VERRFSKPSKKPSKNPILMMAIALLIASCNDRDSAGYTAPPINAIGESLLSQSIEHLTTIQPAYHRNARAASLSLGRSINAFLVSPDEDTRESMRNSWLDAHQHFLAARFFSLVKTDLRSFSVDAWPIQEGFLDYLPGHQHSGIINDLTLHIDPETLKIQHGITDTEEVSLGFHALEFLIFSRSLEDYSRADDEQEGEIVQRRRRALKVITEILLLDIETVLSQSRDTTAEVLTSNGGTETLQISSLLPVMEALSSRVSLLFIEANDISEVSGHSRFSQSSWHNLQTQVGILSELTGEQTKFPSVFLLLDKTTASDYRLTLEEALGILSMNDPDEESRTRLILLIAALGHQLVDLKIALEQRLQT
jgi:uncharacterized iron-regulated protein